MGVDNSAENALAIDTRHQTLDKYSQMLEHLTLVGQAGNEQYGDEPYVAVQQVKEMDSEFGTDIDSALRRIEQDASVRNLQGQWRAQCQIDPHSELDAEQQGAMHDFVEARLDPSKPVVRLPLSGGLAGKKHQDASSRLREEGRTTCIPSFAEQISRRQKQEQHPASVVTAPRRPMRVPPPVSASSQLETLFSKSAEADPGDHPTFLRPPDKANNRKLVVQLKQEQHKSKMMGSRGRTAGSSGQQKPAASPRRPTSAARFLEDKRKEPKQIQVEKEEGQPLEIHFDPETLCLIDAKRGSPGDAALAGCRGMRITGVSASPDGGGEALNAAALRRALASCQGSSVVYIDLKPWSARLAVEKRRSEFRQKFAGRPAAKEKSKAG